MSGLNFAANHSFLPDSEGLRACNSMANLTEMAMTKPRSKKALFIGLPLALAISAGAGFAVWHHWFKEDLATRPKS